MAKVRKAFSAEALFKLTGETFKGIKEPATNRPNAISLADCLLSGLAVFSLKYPSLLQFDHSRTENENLKRNLRTLYGVQQVPCDTQMRERLDPIKPEKIRKPFKAIFSRLQRGKILEQYRYLNQSYLLSIDGTGDFFSTGVHCDNCCEKNHKDGSTSYYHQLLGAAIVHPDNKVVIPLAPEPILKQDGMQKNDCERNAAKRLLENLRREHPHLKVILVEDGLSSNAPHIETLKSLNFSFILGVKPGDHKFLFEWVEGEFCTYHEEIERDGTIRKFKFINNAPLNATNLDCKVNFIEYWEVKKSGEKQHFSWVTDLTITKQNVFAIMRGGRARWRIENETFNTLKNQGYHFSHNFGHGYQNLHTIFSMLMMLAFLIDQTQAFCCPSFKKAWAKMHSKIRLWERMRNVILLFGVQSWKVMFDTIANGMQPVAFKCDTS